MVFTSIVRWVRLKYYQYSVTISLYMLTPGEQLVFNIGVLLLLGMILTATILYLPEHVSTVLRRTTFYFFGHDHHTSPEATDPLLVKQEL